MAISRRRSTGQRILISHVAFAVAAALVGCGDDETAAGPTGGGGTGTAATGGQGGTPTGTSTGIGGQGGSGTGTGTGGTTGAWRAFNDQSPWNTPIGADPAIDPDSDALIADFATSSTWPFLGINIASYGIPVFWADSSTPMANVDTTGLGGEGFHDQNPTPVPIPAGAAPDPDSDGHMCIIDRALGTEWGFWQASHVSGSDWNCSVCATADLNGTGVRPPKDGNQDWWLSHGSRACGFPLIAGLITVDEMQAGRIEHALVIAYPHIRSRYYTPPASTAQGTTTEALPSRGIPCGGRIQLDPSLDLSTLGLTPSGLIIAQALQEYGAFVGDYSGAMSLYADGSAQAQAVWDGGLLGTYEVRDQIDLTDFRVLQIGQLYDDNN
ncbi:MAG: hypothetical protein JRI23_03580 [Deltaproteobacteria bacterium]|jgi:hypothetical protein|nr:hypothetical protein [Deltaproteobacteria bacterium]MBW2530597.1 hypothetical protein [Deltaproteobacteria bacterium]